MIERILYAYALIFWVLCPLLALRVYRPVGYRDIGLAAWAGVRIAHEMIWTFLVFAFAIVVAYYEVTRHVFT